MTDEQIDAMMAEIIKELDYDIYKDVFEAPEDDEEAGESLAFLRDCVRKHLKQAWLPAYP